MNKPIYKWFVVSTGTYKRKFKEQTPKRAILYAFRSWPPSNPAPLTCVYAVGEIRFYFDTIDYLKKAGYRIIRRGKPRP